MADETTEGAPEATEVEVEVTVADDGSEGIKTLEDALEALKKVRAEAARRRVSEKELKEKATKYDEYVQSQKTELERLTEDKAALEKEAKALKEKDLRSTVASKHDLDPDLIGLLVGSEEEMETTAKLLVAKGGKRSAGTNTDFYAGQRGTPVQTTPANTTQEWFEKMWDESNSTKRF